MRFVSQGPSLVAHTPAKLNLFLEVLGRRPDGYHELETVMVSIGLYDTLLFTEDAPHRTRLRCHNTTAQSRPHADRDGDYGSDNLVIRAAELLREHTGCERGVTIDLWKRIPVRAGLGGGSSDAAATLVGLNRLWRTGLSSAQLHELAARLGSDVNFFLDSRVTARCTGRGEDIAPLPLSGRLHFVVVCPWTGLSTADVFRRWQRSTSRRRVRDDFTKRLMAGRVRMPPDNLWNALESPAQELNPDIGRTLDALRGAGASTVLMSGSGSSCFAVCRSVRHADAIAGRLRSQSEILGRVLTVDSRA